MGYVTNGLSFRTMRDANEKRLPLFRNKLGEVAHTQADGSDWSKAEWLQAVLGELGELANLMKKVRRGDLTEADAHAEIRKEIADVQIYLDLLALQYGIDLGNAVADKFNEVSRRVKADVFIKHDLSDWTPHDPEEV